MLRRIRIQNHALIHEVEMTLEKGFHVFTGETGSGRAKNGRGRTSEVHSGSCTANSTSASGTVGARPLPRRAPLLPAELLNLSLIHI